MTPCSICRQPARESKPVFLGGRDIKQVAERRTPGACSITLRGENGTTTLYLCADCTGILSDWLITKGLSEALVPMKSAAVKP